MLPSYDKVASVFTGHDAWNQLVQHRNRAVAQRNRHAVIGGIIAVAGAGMMAYALGTTSLAAALDDPGLEGYFYLFLLGIVVILCSLFYVRAAFRRTRKRFSRICKSLMLSPLVDSMVNDSRTRCTYRANGRIATADLLAFPIFWKLGRADLMTGEDHLTGSLGGADFQLCGISAKMREYETEYTRKVRLFEGLVFIADFHHKTSGTIVIESRKGRKNEPLPRAGQPMDGFTHDFDREFRVWTTDEKSARELLQAEMLERLVRLRERFPKNGMNVCLHHGKLAIAIHDVHLFEVKGLQSLEEESIRDTYDDIRSVLDIVDRLNLNLRAS